MRIIVFLLFCFVAAIFAAEEEPKKYGYVAVANRGDATFVIIDSETDTIVKTVNMSKIEDRTLNTSTLVPEPMYPIIVGQYIFIGDRRNKEVTAFDIENDFEYAGSTPVGAGIFHMYNTLDGSQMWVMNDLDDTVSVFDCSAPPFPIIDTIDLPSDCCFNGAPLPQPHDIIFDPNGLYAYITIFGVPGPADLILKYNVSSREELDRIETGKSPHIALMDSPTLPGYIWPILAPCQGSFIDSLVIIDPVNWKTVDSLIGMAGAHGIYGPSADKRTFYVTNLPGLGTDGLFAFDAVRYEVIPEATVDTPYGTPHNLAMNPAGTKLYLTHSGTFIQVSVWSVGDPQDPKPKYLTEIDSGLNAYGIQFFETDFRIGQAAEAGALSGFMFSLIELLI